MSCNNCGFGADFQTNCGHLLCFTCFSNYIRGYPKYPIQCLCCTRILTPKECMANLFEDDLNIFKSIKDNFLIRPYKKPKPRIPLKYKFKYKCVSKDEIIKLKIPNSKKNLCSICHQEHSGDQTCPSIENVEKLVTEPKKEKKESMLVAYSKFMKTYGKCSEEELINICKSSGWLYTGRKCPNSTCNKIDLDERTHTGKLIWRCSRCDSTFSAKQSTWFSKSVLSFYDILQLTFCWILDLSQPTTMKMTGKSTYSVTCWFKKCRRHAIDIIERYAQKIGGINVNVEIDLVLFGRARIVRGSRLLPQWYIGLIEQGNNRSLMVLPIENCNNDTLESIISEWVAPGSIIYTDGWCGFRNLQNMGYGHIIYENPYPAKSALGKCTNAMKSSWDLIRSGCPERGSKRKYTTSYMISKIWRERNDGLSALEKFQEFMKTTLDCKCTKIKTAFL